jgi:hypothetical protein
MEIDAAISPGRESNKLRSHTLGSHMLGSRSIVIIQHSCDPPRYEPDTKDTIYNERLSSDAQGLRNARTVWTTLRKGGGCKCSTMEHTRLLNEDFTMVRGPKGGADLPPQGFYEYHKRAGDARCLMTAQRSLVRSKTASVCANDFVNAFRNGTIVYLPVHGGHPLDFPDGDEHTPAQCQFRLPDDVYVMSFNPPDSDALFLCGEVEDEFLRFLSGPDALGMIASPSNRRRRFESEFYKNLRVYGPGDIIMNKGIVSDKDCDLMKRESGENNFGYMRKSRLRDVLDKDIAELYTEVVRSHRDGNNIA